MGYKRKSKVFKLTFADAEYEGLEVRVKSLSTGKLLDLGDMVDDVKASKSKDTAQARELFRVFAGALVGWNLEEEDGTPIPATLSGALDQDFDFTFMLIESWMDAMTGVVAPLVARSTSGGPSAEASLPMETLSPSPQL